MNKRLIGLLLLAAFVGSFGAGLLLSAGPASAAPSSCTTTCNPDKCPLKCANQGMCGGCVRTGPNCYACQCTVCL